MSISIGQLDLEALKNYLKIVQGFRTIDDPSSDTELVGGVGADSIAIVAKDKDGDFFLDENGNNRRDIVNAALSLVKQLEDGTMETVDVAGLLTEDEGLQLKDTALNASTNVADDMKSLRNEMYHLKRDMMRAGALSFDPVYNGFVDPFINGNEVYTLDELYIDNSIGSISVEGEVSLYDKGQHAALISGSNLLTIDEVTDIIGQEVTLGDGQLFVSSTPDTLQKSFGIYHNGRFVFGSTEANINTADSVNMIYKDGVNRIKILEINEANGILGFARTFEVPADLIGNYLNGIRLTLTTIGMPGTCQVELYKYDEGGVFGEPIAVSNQLNAGEVINNEWKSYNFTFDKDIFLEQGQVFVLLLKAMNTYTNNVWCVGGYYELFNNDIDQHTFIYNIDEAFIEEGALVGTNQLANMFLGLNTTKNQRADITYSNKGLYTGTFDLEDVKASRVRVSFNPRRDANIDFYKVLVKGRTENGYIDGEQVGERKVFNHIKIANGEQSGKEYVFDFNFDEQVDKVEFQIIFNVNAISDATYEALYSVVVSTDNAYLGGDN